MGVMMQIDKIIRQPNGGAQCIAPAWGHDSRASPRAQCIAPLHLVRSSMSDVYRSSASSRPLPRRIEQPPGRDESRPYEDVSSEHFLTTVPPQGATVQAKGIPLYGD